MDYRAGMFVYALAFLLGVVIVQQLADLLTLNQLFGVLCGFVVVIVFAGSFARYYFPSFKKQYTLILYCIILILIGIIFASIYANHQLSYRLHENLTGKNLLLTGSVVGLPVVDGNVQRFEFHVEQFQIIGVISDDESGDDGIMAKQRLNAAQRFPRKIRLSWYYGPDIRASEKWQLEVRLKAPHGFLNPGGFDYEGWLFQHGIQATGYVRQSVLNQKQNLSPSDSLLPSISRLREKIGHRIELLNQNRVEEKFESSALIKALAIGDKSAISKQQWGVLSATGTSHLMAISGLHIGLAALFAYVLIRRTVPVFIIKAIPAQHIALIGSMFVALLYALIAGFSVPTQRAFIMLFVLSLMMLIRQNHRPVDALGFALFLVLLIDPLAVLSVGFWFSFSAVAVIFISFSSHETGTFEHHKITSKTVTCRIISILKKWIHLQLLISLFLLPLSLFMFQQVSLISPLANLILIPYVSFLVVPVVLLAMCFIFISPEIADQMFNLSVNLLDLIWPVLNYFSAQPYALWVQGDFGIVKLLITSVVICLIYFSRTLARILAGKLVRISAHNSTAKSSSKHLAVKIHLFILMFSLVLIIPVFTVSHAQLQTGEYEITVLDVGQGSAAVVKTQNHVAVFDAGARFSEKLDTSSNIIIPYLRSQSIQSIDRLIISHGDADHIGGAAALLDAFPDTTVIGQDIDKLKTNNKKLCYSDIKWQWDGVDFEFLSPLKSDQAMFEQEKFDHSDIIKHKRNNHSCVLKISSATGSTLFTGDIEKTVEQQLLYNARSRLKSDVLIVPHHGSRTSSSRNFIDAVSSKISIFSVGYKNRYKLPNKKVVARYQASNGQLLRTDKNGAITIFFSNNEKIEVEKYRDQTKKYWHHSID